MKVVIRAGGVGSRLWPVSRQAKPKQFHALTSKQTMLEEAIERVRPIVALEDIYVSANTTSQQYVRDHHHEISAENIIVEPARKDTAAAIGLESVIIAHSNPQAVVASLGSDHSIKRTEEFQNVLKSAEQFVSQQPEYILAIGLRPTRPDTGYGYIECGDTLAEIGDSKVFHVNQFREKPDAKTAKAFVAEPQYLWNGNMFVWRVDTILALYEQYLPEMYAQLQEIAASLGTPEQEEVINRVYPQMEKIAVDYAIIEKAEKRAAVAAEIGWNDVGDWARLKDELAEEEGDNVAIGAEHLDIDSKNVLVYSNTEGKKIATVGVDNIIVVDTGDALLVLDKYRSGDVKTVVEQLQQDNPELL